MKIKFNLFLAYATIACIAFSACKKPNDAYLPTPFIPGELKFLNYTVQSDNNEDFQISPGENITLKVNVSNTGKTTIRTLNGSLSTKSNYILNLEYKDATFYYNESNYPYNFSYVEPGKKAYNVFTFKVQPNTPVGTEISFYLDLIDADKTKYQDTFKIMIVSIETKMAFGHFELNKEFNADGKINNGEVVKIIPYIKNIGAHTVKNPKAEFVVNSSYVSDFSPISKRSFYGNSSNGSYNYENKIVSGSEGFVIDPQNYLSFKINPNTPNGTIIPIKVIMTDDLNNEWIDTMNVKVEKPDANVKFGSYKIYKESNLDGKIKAGETVTLQIKLNNLGIATAPRVKGIYSTSNINVSNVMPSGYVKFNKYGFANKSGEYDSYDFIYGQEEGTTAIEDYLTFKVDNTAIAGTKITFNINLTDQFQNAWVETFDVLVE